MARDTLRLSEQDLANNASSVTVTVHATGAAGAAVTQTATIRIQGDRPVASFTYDKGNDGSRRSSSSTPRPLRAS